MRIPRSTRDFSQNIKSSLESIIDNTKCYGQRIYIVYKARRSRNALAGLGIRKCGLTRRTCNILFRRIVISTGIHGCDILKRFPKSLEQLMSFQIHAAKGIKGLFPELQMSAVYFHHDARDWKELCNFVNVHT